MIDLSAEFALTAFLYGGAACGWICAGVFVWFISDEWRERRAFRKQNPLPAWKVKP